MIVASLLLIGVAVVLLVLGLWQPSSALLAASIGASLLAAVVLVIGARQSAAARVAAGNDTAEPERHPRREDPPREDLHREDLHREDLHREDLHREDLHREDLHGDDDPPRDGPVRQSGPAVGRDLHQDTLRFAPVPAAADRHAPEAAGSVSGAPDNGEGHAEHRNDARRGGGVGFPLENGDGPRHADSERSLDEAYGSAGAEPVQDAYGGQEPLSSTHTSDGDAYPGGEPASGADPGVAGGGAATRTIPLQAALGSDRVDHRAGPMVDSGADHGTGHAAEDEAEPADEPSAQQVSAADAARVGRMATEVLVVDGRPRYHLPGCVHLLGRESEPLPVGEAIELGFTPCSLCEPDSALLADARRV